MERKKTLEERVFMKTENTRKRAPRKSTKKESSVSSSKITTKKETKGENNLDKKPLKENIEKNVVETKRRSLPKFEFKRDNLKIIPLGGLDEIGKNITVFEYGNEIVLVDCGLEFPEDDMLGVDLVIPDVTYLEKNKEKIRGMVITHGHEDHIGAIPYILRQINIPIYATKLTVGLIKNKLEEHKLLSSTKLIPVEQGQTINFGSMKVEFIRSNHSIPDSVMLAIHTPIGVILHTGDFKVDFTPIDDMQMDLGRIAELGNKGVIALLSDSTNSERKGTQCLKVQWEMFLIDYFKTIQKE